MPDPTPANEDLADELAALCAIYADAADDASEIIAPSPNDPSVLVLRPPITVVAPQLDLHLRFPPTYPDDAPMVLDTGACGGASGVRDGQVADETGAKGLARHSAATCSRASSRRARCVSTTWSRACARPCRRPHRRPRLLLLLPRHSLLLRLRRPHHPRRQMS